MKFDTGLVSQGARNLPSYQAGHIPRLSGHLAYPSQEDEHLHCCLPGTFGIFENLVWFKGGLCDDVLLGTEGILGILVSVEEHLGLNPTPPPAFFLKPLTLAGSLTLLGLRKAELVHVFFLCYNPRR